jgi:4-amino-4-deoxy-L-arabinose transferase-like glycosyltransferase
MRMLRLSAPRPLRSFPWLEPEVGLLLLLVVGTYFSRIFDLSLRGEETRWAQVAVEMMRSGDYVVPHVQGVVFADRPPLNSWAMILASWAVGEWGTLAVRLPSVMALLATTLLVYGYSRDFLGRVGAFAAAAGFASMAQVMELGRLAESEALLTCFVSASLLVWHRGYARGWPPMFTWTAAYVLVALAALGKGPQGPLFFAGGVGTYLVARRDWAYLFSRAHVAGLSIGAVVLGAWLVPFAARTDWATAVLPFSENGALGNRFVVARWSVYARHLAAYPFEVAVSTLPFSLLLAAYVSRRFRRSLGDHGAWASFLGLCAFVGFVLCWVMPHTRSRYFMPLYPCLAPLLGVVVECSMVPSRRAWYQRISPRLAGLAAVVIALGGLTVAGLTVWPAGPLDFMVQPTVFVVVYAVMATLASAMAWRWRDSSDPLQMRAVTFAIATFAGLSFAGVALNAMIRVSTDPVGDAATIRQLVPADHQLVSLGPAHHRFLYHYGMAVPLVPWPTAEQPLDPAVTYFAFEQARGSVRSLPFAWDLVAVYSCDRTRNPEPGVSMVIGRRR